MAYKTVSDLKDSVSGMLQGLSLNNVRNLNTALERTARQVCSKLKIPETTLNSSLTLYDGVTDYAAPTNMLGTSIIDLRPQGQARDWSNEVQKQPGLEFDRQKGYIGSDTKISVEYDASATEILRIASPVPTPRIELDPMTDTTGWTAAASAGSLTKDSTVFWQSPASLRLTLTGASAGTLTKTITTQDLTDYLNVGFVFLAFRTPSGSNLTSLKLRLGSSASAYYEVTVTTGFLKAFASGQWMLAAFDLSTATTTGSPTITAIKYAQLTITHAATLTNFYVGDLWIALPSPQTLYYQSPAIFLASGSTTPSSTISAVSDSVLLNDAAYAIYEVEAAMEIAQQQGGTTAEGVIGTLSPKVNGIRGYRGVLIQPGLIDLYRADNPSQELRTVGGYYEGLYG